MSGKNAMVYGLNNEYRNQKPQNKKTKYYDTRKI